MKGVKVGYVRVSTMEQCPDRQLQNMQLDKIYTEYASGKDTHRPQLSIMMDYLRDGDQL
jgi:DNA invertase Pin-like site-specific DNA recombinase